MQHQQNGPHQIINRHFEKNRPHWVTSPNTIRARWCYSLSPLNKSRETVQWEQWRNSVVMHTNQSFILTVSKQLHSDDSIPKSQTVKLPKHHKMQQGGMQPKMWKNKDKHPEQEVGWKGSRQSQCWKYKKRFPLSILLFHFRVGSHDSYKSWMINKPLLPQRCLGKWTL